MPISTPLPVNAHIKLQNWTSPLTTGAVRGNIKDTTDVDIGYRYLRKKNYIGCSMTKDRDRRKKARTTSFNYISDCKFAYI
ncbi:hypothetical protein SKAU_G00414840 [Synaphobranchus kaupii]|uniref:Uncharacterized protein n=1 Tax=Synaphobranchus kaupii TaxID=118154 RepID=A0A9Q1E769_SYNKA|nr:hypothetical protein SKAU_G00414840 [Synaphobranchus kaupii]